MRTIAVMLVAILVHTSFVAAATPSSASTTAPVAVSTAVPTIQITPHNAKKAPQNSKWGWKEWAIVIGSILTMGAVAAIEVTNHPSGSGSNSGSGMSGM